MTINQPEQRRLALNLMSSERFGDGTFSAVLRSARIADELGVDLVVLPDHVVMHEPSVKERDGFPYSLHANWFEPLTALSAIAAVTQRVRLGMNVLVAPLRPAVLLAKQIATLDAISRGRVEAAFGVGWQRSEYEAAERDFDRRFGMLEEQIQVCRALWRGGPSAHHGSRLAFDELHSYPLPPQGAALPISLGLGLTPRGKERIVRLADGWTPPPMSARELKESIAELQETSPHGKRLRVTAPVSLPHESARIGDADLPNPLDEALDLWDAGAETVIVHPSAFCSSPDDLRQFLEPLLAARDSYPRIPASAV